ncbi:MAG: aldehyde dehydrogenase family protein, partial [Armatimonadetes bacterium]|nr:aldehyde dehydrogenase family protein [Armatimonadota bacterium]MDW8154748.1 aldehyde dehydrogenase family protein [Armatimonadota bacterium]
MGLPEFCNEPFTDFRVEAHQRAMRQAIAAVEGQLGVELPVVIGRQRLRVPETFESRNPSKKDEVVARAPMATAELVDRAVDAAWRAFPAWKRVPPEEKAALFLRAAELLRRRKFEAAAWMVLEVGKNWAEADADVAEAIDHLEYFAREILRYAEGKPTTPHPQEISYYTYEPLGVVAVIPPWNFPLAIPMGMALGAIAAGNTVVLKPSSDAPATAYVFLEVMEQAGLPPGVLNVLPGSGSVVGEGLVTHPRVRMVAFTGSREVGCRIYEQAARIHPGQKWLKRVIAEMGGKNAVVVAEDADLEEAVAAAVASGYGYQGQKCSAGSRLVVTEPVYQQVLEAFVEQVRSLQVGPAKDNYPVGPVINERAYRSILDYVEVGKREGRLLCGGEPADGD